MMGRKLLAIILNINLTTINKIAMGKMTNNPPNTVVKTKFFVLCSIWLKLVNNMNSKEKKTLLFDLDFLIKTKSLLSGNVRQTPLLSFQSINQDLGCHVYFKCENYQLAGSFKYRPALSAILRIPEEKRNNGVVTHSSGNFGQAIALACHKVGIPATIVMPKGAPEIKKKRVRKFGGTIVECDNTMASRYEHVDQILAEQNMTFVHPSNQTTVIAGNATIFWEIIEEKNDVDTILVPLGGGGITSGICCARHLLNHHSTIIGCEPSGADDAYRSIKAGRIITNDQTNTIADGLRSDLGDLTYEVLSTEIDNIQTIEDEWIEKAMQMLWEEARMTVEPSSAISLATVLKNKEQFTDKKLVCVLTGGNVDLSKFSFYTT